MLKLVFSDKFDRKLRNFLKKHPELVPTVREKFLILEKNPKDKRIKTHKLTGKLSGLFAASITYEYRIVFYLDKNDIFLLAIGTHDEVY